MLVRTWNVFHGNAVPPERRAFLERDDPARERGRAGRRSACRRCRSGRSPRLEELERHAGGPGARGAAAAAGRCPGHAAARPRRDRRPSRALRSALTGQANAILVAPPPAPARARPRSSSTRAASGAAQARRLGLDRGRPARVGEGAPGLPRCARRAGRAARPSSRTCTRRAIRRPAARRTPSCSAPPPSPRRFARARTSRCVLAGDLNVIAAEPRATLPDLAGHGASRRRRRARPRARPRRRRRPPAGLARRAARVDGRLLSDHAPVEGTSRDDRSRRRAPQFPVLERSPTSTPARTGRSPRATADAIAGTS